MQNRFFPRRINILVSQILFTLCSKVRDKNEDGLKTVGMLVMWIVPSVMLRFLVFSFAWSLPGTERVFIYIQAERSRHIVTGTEPLLRRSSA